MNKKLVLALVAIVVIATVGVFTPTGKSSILERVVEKEKVGSVATLDGVDSPKISIADKESAQRRIPMVATSSALCSLGPADVGLGTSTANFSFTMATSSIARSEYVSLSTSTTIYGSSTNAWMKVTVPQYGSRFGAALHWNSATTTTGSAAGTGAADLWAGTNASGTSAYIVLPTEKLNLKIGSSTPGTFTTFPQGTCSYEFIEV